MTRDNIIRPGDKLTLKAGHPYGNIGPTVEVVKLTTAPGYKRPWIYAYYIRDGQPTIGQFRSSDFS